LHKTCVGKPFTFLRKHGNFHDYPQNEAIKKAVKLPNQEEVPAGVRKMSDDLKDYKGHLKSNGTVEPWKIL
jgi:hypothetical protein